MAHVVCPDDAYNGGQPGAFMPYEQTRRLIAPHWPVEPPAGQQLDLQPQCPREAAPDLT